MEFCRDRDWPVGGKVLNAYAECAFWDFSKHVSVLGMHVGLGRDSCDWLGKDSCEWWGWFEVNLIFARFAVGFELYDEDARNHRDGLLHENGDSS